MSGPWQQLTDLSDRPVPAWAAAGATVLAAVGVAAVVFVVAHRPRSARTGRGRRLETVLTVAAAGIATGVSASGMWQVFGDALDMSGPARVAVFGFVELAIAVSAVRARRALRETGSTGVDGAAVWVLAVLTAVLSALDSNRFVEVLLRLAAPLVAAWLWERGLAPDRRAGQVRHRRGPVAWRVTRERVLVWLRLAEPAERAVAEVDRARKVARLTRAAWRYHSLIAAGAAGWRVSRAAAVLRRHTLAGVEHLALGDDDRARDSVRRSLATLYQVTDGTAPAALTDLTPWGRPAAAPVAEHTPRAPAGPDVTPAGDVSAAPDADHLGRPGSRWTAGVQLSNGHLSSVQRVQPPAAPDLAARPREAGTSVPVEHTDGPALNTPTARPADPAAVPASTLDLFNVAVTPSPVPEQADQPWARPRPTSAAPTPPEVDSAASRAEWAACRYRDAHHALPTARDLSSLANVSTGTAGTVLKALRDTRPTPSSTSNDRQQTSPPEDDSDQTTHQDHPTHDSHHTNKIQKSYTPRHHDPEEDQLRDAGAPAGPPSGEPDEPDEPSGTAPRPAGDPVGVG